MKTMSPTAAATANLSAARIDIRESRIAFVFRDENRSDKVAPALPFARTGEGAGEVYQADSGDDGEAAPDDVEAGDAR